MTEQNDIADSKKLDVETIIQFAAVLGQMAGLFLVKPEIFNIYENKDIFLAGNYANFLLIIISIVFIYFGMSFIKYRYARYWLALCLIIGVGFAVSYFSYSNLLENKTVLLQTDADIVAVRIIKGDHYLPNVQKCAETLKSADGVVNDLEVIQNCGDIKVAGQLDAIWPRQQILKNARTLLLFYSLSLLCGCISLITGLQAIKCKKSKKLHQHETD